MALPKSTIDAIDMMPEQDACELFAMLSVRLIAEGWHRRALGMLASVDVGDFEELCAMASEMEGEPMDD